MNVDFYRSQKKPHAVDVRAS